VTSIAAPLRQPLRRHSLLRRAAVRAAECATLAVGGRAWYRRSHLRAPGLRVRRELILHPELPDSLCGLRVAQLSDLHAGPFLGAGDLAGVLALLDELAPDLLVVTGDFVAHSIDDVRPILGELGRLGARLGVFAVFGNHDYRGRREAQLASELERRGIVVLRDRTQRIELDGAALCVVGVEDLEEAKHVDLARARAGVRPGDFEIVLCHHPAGAPFCASPRTLAVLSGHTHGGQIDLPLLRRAGPAHPGARVQLGATRLVTSRGLGVIGIPLRVGAPAEIVLLELERGAR
jgi:hypothetical protein